jgi:dipeptidase E
MGYLDHAADEIAAFLAEGRRLAFVPFALHDHEGYGAKVRERLAPLGIEVTTVRADGSGAEAIGAADAVFVGGGNTFRLLDRLQRKHILDLIRKRSGGGMPYIGSSAGSVIAGPTIRTTNDMPIMQPASFDSLGLVPFQLNCHYLDVDPASTHMGETRETRLREFHEENDTTIVGLREGAILRVEGDDIRLRGNAGARIFVKGSEPAEHPPGADLSFLASR